MLKKLNNKKGFTLMEMLIVVAIIAILVAIAIPAFNSSLNKARVATDEANIRAEYAEAMVEYLDGTATSNIVKTVTATGNSESAVNIAGESVSAWTRNQTITITVDKDTGTVTFTVG